MLPLRGKQLKFMSSRTAGQSLREGVQIFLKKLNTENFLADIVIDSVTRLGTL